MQPLTHRFHPRDRQESANLRAFDVALLAYHALVPDRPLVMRCGRRYAHRKLPGPVGCDWPWTITIPLADDGTTPASFTWTA
ncbi:hypothetical protein [Qaidamihabitans albus]|uniref:hypothetical protein n=1 Tax=Qaidamihabitans albus TaxID=2795733 RepID=UPI0018F24736|nr:hypothetical protein [Qaidamihabitans albus]